MALVTHRTSFSLNNYTHEIVDTLEKTFYPAQEPTTLLSMHTKHTHLRHPTPYSKNPSPKKNHMPQTAKT